jgi:hypothetical protein
VIEELLLPPLRWLRAMVEEVQHAPETLRTIRRSVDELARLPDQLDDLLASLQAIPQGVEHLDTVVSDLGRTLTAIIGGIPGARRALRNTGSS